MPASWPVSLKIFTAKVDNTDIVYAADVNELQAEVSALETYLGTNPHISTARAVTYATVDARFEALEADALLKTGGTATANIVVDKGTPKVTVGGTAVGEVSVEKDATTASTEVIGRFNFYGQDDGANRTLYAALVGYADDVTGAAEDGRVDLSVLKANVETAYLSLRGTDAGPRLSTNILLSSNAARRFQWGTGTPEGVVTAGVGSVFVRDDGAAGTTFYVKETGAGNTGWFALGGASDDVISFGREGTLVVTAGKGRHYWPFAVEILGVRAAVNTASAGADIILDVNKNGTTIFTTQGNRPTIAAAATVSAAEAVPDSPARIYAAGDYTSVDIDQVGSSTAGADLTTVIRYKKV